MGLGMWDVDASEGPIILLERGKFEGFFEGSEVFLFKRVKGAFPLSLRFLVDAVITVVVRFFMGPLIFHVIRGFGLLRVFSRSSWV